MRREYMLRKSKISIQIGGKRLLMLLALPALALMLLLSTTGALAGKLTDTSNGLSKQASTTSNAAQTGSLSTRDLSKLTRMERTASSGANSASAPGSPNDN